jgi:hypothetical protein
MGAVGFVGWVSWYVVAFAAITATSWAAGWIATASLRRAGEAIAWPMTIAIGLALLAQATLLLAMAAALRRPVIIALTLVLVLVAISRVWRTSPAFNPITTAVAIAAVPLFLLALYPPLGFDETMYHLPYARAFAASGAAPFLPMLRFPIFPQLAEMLNAAVLAVTADDVATHLVGWLAFAASVGLAWICAREESSPAAGWVAAATLVGSPNAMYLAASGYVEPMLGLFGVGALYAARRQGVAWALIAGLLAGSAGGVKYLGLFFLPAAALLLLPRWRDVAIFAIAATVALLPSYGRIVAYTGNPLFPFHPEWFGVASTPWNQPSYLGAEGLERWRLASTLLWDMTFRRQLVGGEPFLSPAFVFGVPFMLIGAWRLPRLRPLLLIAFAYLLAMPAIATHYFIGIAPLFGVLIGVSLALLLSARVVAAIAVMLALGGEAYAGYRLVKLGLPPTTLAGRDQVLARERPLYPAIAWLNRTAGPAVIYVVNAEQMVYYASGTMLGDFSGPHSFGRVMARTAETGSLARALQESGATYLVVPAETAWWTAQADADPRLVCIDAQPYARIYQVQR